MEISSKKVRNTTCFYRRFNALNFSKSKKTYLKYFFKVCHQKYIFFQFFGQILEKFDSNLNRIIYSLQINNNKIFGKYFGA
jgi:hypothetical protein